MIYIIKSSEYLKIGYSANKNTLRTRISSYRTHNPDFELLSVFYGDRNDEKELHKLCKKFKYKTEWFHLSDEVMNIIDVYKCGKELTDDDTIYFLESLFGSRLQEIDVEIGEIYNSYSFMLNNNVNCQLLIINKNTAYLYVNKIGEYHKIFNISINSLKTYYKDYNDFNDSRYCNATLINDIIIAEIREYGKFPYTDVFRNLDSLPGCIDINRFSDIRY